MPHAATGPAAALILFLPVGEPLLVGLPADIELGAGLLMAQRASCQKAFVWIYPDTEKYEKGDYQEARADFIMAIEIEPFVARHNHDRGLAKMKA